MAQEELVETIYGKYSKFEIIKKTSLLSGIEFFIRKNGKPYKGGYSSLSSAVNAAKKEAG